nr:cytochrome b561 homolog 1-like [Nerophis lumbriciformis]
MPVSRQGAENAKTMIRNSPIAYGSVAKWLHWLTALCFLVAYVAFYYGHWFTEPRTPDRRLITAVHAMFGFSVLIMVLPRLIWKWSNVSPEPDPAPRWQHVTANLAHFALYFFIIAMPLSGWMGYGGRVINMFWLFEIPTFRYTQLFVWLVEGKLGLTWDEWEAPIDFFHKKIAGAWLVWILIGVHAGAALYHHFVQKDNTLRRMLPGARVIGDDHGQ